VIEKVFQKSENLQVDSQTENFSKNVQFFNFHKHNNKANYPETETEMSTVNQFTTQLGAYLAEKFEGLDINEVTLEIEIFIEQAKPAILSKPTSSKTTKTDKPAKEPKAKAVRRSSAAKEADEIFAANEGKMVLIQTEHPDKGVIGHFLAFNGVDGAKATGDAIKSLIKGKGISAKDNKDFGLGLAIPVKNYPDVEDALKKYLDDNDVEYIEHTHSKTAKAPTSYNLFQKAKRAEALAKGEKIELADIAKLWADSDDKKKSDAAAAAKLAEKKAESERKKAEKEAEKAAKAKK
jgi:hypothetical protein